MAGKYTITLDTDDPSVGGQGRVDHSVPVLTSADPFNNRPHSAMLYIPSRVALVLAKVD